MNDDTAAFKMCDHCHKAYKVNPHTAHECAHGIPLNTLQQAPEDVNVFGYHGQKMPAIFYPITRISRIFYNFFAVPVCAFFTILAMALYGKEMLDHENALPGLLCFIWFVAFTVICGVQAIIWSIIFIPARYSREYFQKISVTFLGSMLKRDSFYVALNKCQYAMMCCVSVEFLFLVVAQYAIIDHGTLDQNFGILMGVPCIIHLVILLVRLLAWSQETFDETFHMPWWDPVPSTKVKKAYYEYELTSRFLFIAELYGLTDVMMGLFAVAVTYGLTEYTSKTDKVYQFFETFHPCVLIDHYPASLVGLFLIGIREVVGLYFNLMLLAFVYCRTGPIEAMWSFGVIITSQLLLVVIVNAFSAQLYTEADLGTTVENWHGLTEQDLLNVREHTLSYCIWLAGMVALFFFQFRMMYRFNIPFGNGSKPTRIFWHVFFVIGNIFTISMTAAMIVAITYQSMEWTHDPSSFIQVVIGFMFNVLQGKYLMLMVAPVQRRMFPPDLGMTMRVTANPERGRFGILGRSENAMSLVFWILGFLVFGTYLLDDNVERGVTLFPLARGFRMKPAVFVFAPVWFCCCMIIAYAVFLKVQEAAAGGASPFRVLAIKVIGLFMVGAAMMCLFMTIPLWGRADEVTIALVICFPLWFFVTQGVNIRSLVYVAVYIVLSVLSAVHNVATQLNVIASVLLLFQLILYPCCFKRPDITLFLHFEVLSQRRVVDFRQATKHYEMVPSEGGGAYAEREEDYALAAAEAQKRARKSDASKDKAAAAEAMVATADSAAV